MFISIIIASYNYEKYISQAIQSVINQTYKNWELIIVDDGSSDNSISVIEEFVNKDKRIKFYQHSDKKNHGLVETLKLALIKSSGEWIAFLESDDVWMEDCLEKRVEVLKNYQNVGLIFNNVDLIGDDKKIIEMSNVVKSTQDKLIQKKYPSNMFRDFALNNPILTFSSVMIKHSVINEKYFNPTIDKLFDWWLYIHLAKDNEFLYLNLPLTKWRMHFDSYINKNFSTPRFVQLDAYYDVFLNEKSIKMFFMCVSSWLKFIFSKKFFTKIKNKVMRNLNL